MTKPILRAALVCGALVLSAIPAAADNAALVVLAAARQASGGDGWDAVNLIETTGSETYSGTTGTFRDVQDVRTGRFRHDDAIGFVHYAAVWDGVMRWKQDLSGGVHPLRWLQAESVAEAWLARRGYLRPDAGGAVFTVPKAVHEAGANYVVMLAEPPGAQPVEMWFDTGTHRLARTMRVMSTYKETVRYEDYRREGGVMLAHKMIVDDGDPASIETYVVKSCRFTAAADGAFARPKAPDDSTIAGGSTTVPVEFDGNVVVEAKINGQGPFAFILDTGGHDILTPAVAAALGLKPEGAGVSGGAGEGTVTEQYAHIASLQIGAMTLRDQIVTVIPMSYDTVERGARPPLAGILGLELFERFAMRLDYRARTLSFAPLDGYKHSGGGTAVSIGFSDDIPLLDGVLDGYAGRLALDTGNSGSLVVQGHWAEQNGLADRMRSGFEMVSFGMGGQSRNWATRADLEIAGTALPHIVGRYANDASGSFSSITEAGNIGNDVLANFTLDFDYGHSRIWFEPAAGWTPQPFNRAGVSLSKTAPDAFQVVNVPANTPAADAGLQNGDSITAFDGAASAQLSYWDAGRILRQAPGTKVTLSLVRGGKPQQAVVTLRELLP